MSLDELIGNKGEGLGGGGRDLPLQRPPLHTHTHHTHNTPTVLQRILAPYTNGEH
jgi:hypothetical protein